MLIQTCNALHVFKEIDGIYPDVLGLSIHAVLTQGSNEYYGESLLHISKTRNHMCLNTLGAPFAELVAIESTAKKAIKTGVHAPMQLYLDEQYKLSINFQYGYDKSSKPKSDYSAIMKTNGTNYYYSTCDTLLSVLANEMDSSPPPSCTKRGIDLQARRRALGVLISHIVPLAVLYGYAAC